MNKNYTAEEIQARLKRHFSRKNKQAECMNSKEKKSLERKVRKSFVWIYNIRKSLYLRDEKPLITPEEIEKFTTNILSWPLITHHSLRRFDCLCWDLVHIHELHLHKYNIDIVWIKPFLKEYISKCIDYFIKKIFYHRHELKDLQELFNCLLNDEKIRGKIKWHEVFGERVETIKKILKSRGKKLNEEHLKKLSDDIFIISLKIKSYQRLIRQYETYVGEYQKRRQIFIYSSPYVNEQGKPITNDEQYIHDLTERQGDNDINDEEYNEMIIDHMEEVRDW